MKLLRLFVVTAVSADCGSKSGIELHIENAQCIEEELLRLYSHFIRYY